MQPTREELFGEIQAVFGNRSRIGPEGAEGAPTTVLPMEAGEVEAIARIARRHSVSLIAHGARTYPEPDTDGWGIAVRFDLMGRTRLPDGDEPWVEAEPGVPWLELEDDLRSRGKGLAVYPTSAPRATVGGWLATNGLGVGSFEYGPLRDNVLSASVVTPEGGRREMEGEELRSFVGSGGKTGIVVGAKLRTRRADTDAPFGISFENADDLVRGLEGFIEEGVPLWHLALLNPHMARARRMGEGHLLFGVYPRERSSGVEESLRSIARSHRGRALSPAEAYRAWGERFFPVAPSHPTPRADRRLLSLAELEGALVTLGAGRRAVQGNVARSGEVMLLAFDAF